MNRNVELSGLHNQMQTQQTSLHNFHAENIRLQSDYNAGMLRIQQLEQELGDVLHYKQNILVKMRDVENLASGEASRLGSIKFVRHGQLEGRFLERMQSRIADQHRKQAKAVEAIRENINEIKGKIQMIENDNRG